MLLLDEPTNHMDMATLRRFEQALAEFRGACVLVSHDREFLDQTTDATLFLRAGRLHRFGFSFSQAQQALAAADEAARDMREAQDKKIAALQASAKRLKTWGRDFDNEKLARRARNMEKRVARLEEERVELPSANPLSMQVELTGARSRELVRVTNFDVTVGANVELFHIDDFLLRPRERVALLGTNGVGKSTFIKHLVAAYGDHDQGMRSDVRFSPQAQLGYYDQELNEVAGSRSALDYVVARSRASEATVTRALIAAGFSYQALETPLTQLSGGERARVLFVVLSLATPNLLILDEPTNHIDIEGKEQLEQQLCASDAGVLITSHDRRFIETVAQRFLWITDGGITQLNDPAVFFDSLLDAARATSGLGQPGDRGSASAAPAADLETDDVDQLLHRIDELERKLREDLARKPKFQKPARQSAWREELAVLNARLEALD